MKRILIIEDDVVVANIYRNKFALESFTVEVANDGEAGLSMLSSFKPDLVLLDLMLPKVPGLTILQHIRTKHENPELPVIVFSNTYLASMVESAWRAGATKCLPKASCTPREIIEVIRSVLHTKPFAGQPTELLPGQAEQEDAPITTPASPKVQPPIFGPAGLIADLQSQEDLRRKFSVTLPAIVSGVTPLLMAALKAPTPVTKAEILSTMSKELHTVAGCAGIAGMVRVAQLGQATEALLRELQDKPQHITSSTLRTLANAVDFISVLLKPAMLESREFPGTGNVLVVDDEPTSRRAVCRSLQRANLNRVAVSKAETGLELLEENSFDLVILDIQMPGINGIELCAKLREMPRHADTPVLFVTGLGDFETRANSMMSGGTDLIAKPFLFVELAVKALVYAMRPKSKPAVSPPRVGSPVAFQS